MPSRLCCPNYAIQLGCYPTYVIPILSALGCVDISCHAECNEEPNLKSVNGVFAMILDSSLRCAALRMTGDEGAAFRMTE